MARSHGRRRATRVKTVVWVTNAQQNYTIYLLADDIRPTKKSRRNSRLNSSAIVLDARCSLVFKLRKGLIEQSLRLLTHSRTNREKRISSNPLLRRFKWKKLTAIFIRKDKEKIREGPHGHRSSTAGPPPMLLFRRAAGSCFFCQRAAFQMLSNRILILTGWRWYYSSLFL